MLFYLFFSQVPFLPGAYGIDEFQEMVEVKLYEEFKARPHWGKNNRLTQSKVEEIYPADSLKNGGQCTGYLTKEDRLKIASHIIWVLPNCLIILSTSSLLPRK